MYLEIHDPKLLKKLTALARRGDRRGVKILLETYYHVHLPEVIDTWIERDGKIGIAFSRSIDPRKLLGR